MGSCKYRQGQSVNIREVRLFPRPLTENQVKRENAKKDADARATIGKRIADWLYGKTA